MSSEVEKANLDQMKEKINHLKENATEYTRKAQEEINRLKEQASVYGQNAKEVLDQTGEYIKQNPQKATVIAAGIGAFAGLILGLLIRRD